MPKKLFQPGNPGRPKGSKNKLPQTAKENIVAVFEGMGGVDAMIEWAKKQPGHFYQIYSKVLPLQVEGGDDGKGLIVQIIKLSDVDTLE